VAAGLRDPEEIRRKLRHFEPGALNRQIRAGRLIYVFGGLDHFTTLRGAGTRDGPRAKVSWRATAMSEKTEATTGGTKGVPDLTGS
jgi:hypothetical protein